MNLYRAPRPSSCQNRLCAGFTVRFHMFPHVCSLLIPSTLFQYAFLHSVPPITPLKPNVPFYSFSYLLSPLGPSHYPVKTKSSLSLFSSTVLLSPLDPSHYSVKTNPPSVPPSLLSLFP